MKPVDKFAPIIERIEHLRNQLRMNKSKFSGEIGMKPQTYNNFIGSQGSKPNVELVHGIVNAFGVSPLWLLNGAGPVFLEDSASPYAKDGGLSVSGVMEKESPLTRIHREELEGELGVMEPSLYKIENHVRQLESDNIPVIDRALALVKRYYAVEPVATLKGLRSLLNSIQQEMK